MTARDAPLVLVHGFTAGPAAWDPVLGELRAQHDVHVPALDGHRGGRPLEPGTEPSMEGYVAGLERELDRLGLQQAHLVGNSLGGWLSLALAARGRASSVVCLAPAGGWRPGGGFERLLAVQFALGWVAGSTLRARHLRRPRLRRALLEPMVHHPDRVPPRAAVGILEDLAGCTVLLPSLLRSRRRALGELGPISCPVRIAWSGQDQVLHPRHARARFAELVPGAEQLELPGVGHVPMWDDPAAVAGTILEVTAD